MPPAPGEQGANGRAEADNLPSNAWNGDETETHDAPSEQTPLLPQSTEAPEHSQPQSSAASLLRAFQGDNSDPKKRRRWPSIIALFLLCIVVVLIIIFAFCAPAIVEQYATQAVTFEPTSLSIDAFTASGVRARVQGNFLMDAQKVQNKPVRALGRFGTWIAREAESGENVVEVSLPEYGGVVLGTAKVPAVKVDLRNGHRTPIDFMSDLQPGDISGIRRIANDWIDGRLGQLRVLGKATIPLKSGIFSLGNQDINQELLFDNDEIPSIPAYKIRNLQLHEVEIPTGRGMAADVSLQVANKYPVEFTVPPLGFAILVDGCAPSDMIMVADAQTNDMPIHPKEDVELNVTGVVRQLPHALTRACPGSHDSPLDALLGSYIHGEDTTIYVRGSDSPSLSTPRWITDLMSDITVPVPFPGHTFGHLIKNLSLAETHFSLPNPFAEPNTPEANPQISALVKVLVALPEEMNFNISVGRVRADADVYYHGKKLGKLDLHKWQAANSTRVASTGDDGPTLLVESQVKDAPLIIQDDDLFTDVVQDILFSGKPVLLSLKADVDVELETALGALAVRKIPAQGVVPIKPISRSHLSDSFKPTIRNLSIIATTPDSLTFTALVNLTNPTPYSATVPYADIHILTNSSLLGHATARNLSLNPGVNEDIFITAVWSPASSSKDASEVGRAFLSQYISGKNTTLTLRTHVGSIPALPSLGRALQDFSIDLPTPSLRPPHQHNPDNPSDPDDPDDPDNGDDDGHDSKKGPHFIKDATMHLFSSTATFILLSPLSHTHLAITSIDATAYYHKNEVGRIVYTEPFDVPPVSETEGGEGFATPRLPVDWDLGGVGYEAVRRALGGRLKLSATATVGVGVGEWREVVKFEGGGIGAQVRL